MAELIDPFTNIYDPTCGSGDLLIKSRMLPEKKHPHEMGKAPRLWGQELNPTTFAMAKMNMLLHGYTDPNLPLVIPSTIPERFS